MSRRLRDPFSPSVTLCLSFSLCPLPLLSLFLSLTLSVSLSLFLSLFPLLALQTCSEGDTRILPFSLRSSVSPFSVHLNPRNRILLVAPRTRKGHRLIDSPKPVSGLAAFQLLALHANPGRISRPVISEISTVDVRIFFMRWTRNSRHRNRENPMMIIAISKLLIRETFSST